MSVDWRSSMVLAKLVFSACSVQVTWYSSSNLIFPAISTAPDTMTKISSKRTFCYTVYWQTDCLISIIYVIDIGNSSSSLHFLHQHSKPHFTQFCEQCCLLFNPCTGSRTVGCCQTRGNVPSMRVLFLCACLYHAASVDYSFFSDNVSVITKRTPQWMYLQVHCSFLQECFAWT
jgi:hypothetical protein